MRLHLGHYERRSIATTARNLPSGWSPSRRAACARRPLASAPGKALSAAATGGSARSAAAAGSSTTAATARGWVGVAPARGPGPPPPPPPPPPAGPRAVSGAPLGGPPPPRPHAPRG